MLVYVEFVILNNLLANYFVNRLTIKFAGLKKNKTRLILCTLLGSVMGTLTPLIEVSEFLCTLIKIGCSILLVFILTGKIRFKRYLITFFIFYGVSFGVAGAVLGILNFASFGIKDIKEEELTFGVLLGSLIFSYIAKQISSYIKNRADKGETEIIFEGYSGSVRLRGFFDSGNEVRYKGRGITFIDKRFKDDIKNYSLRDYITVKTVSGEKIFEVYAVQKMKICESGQEKSEIPAIFWESGKKHFDVILYGGDKK